MDQTGIVRLFMDWGFTRLKLWLCNSKNDLLHEESFYTASLTADPSFYGDNEVDKVCDVLNRLLSAWASANVIEIYTSSQMHALAGTFKQGGDFVSTWNDHPTVYSSERTVEVRAGIPLLNSMPENKVLYRSTVPLLSSTHHAKYNDGLDEISFISSPICLLLHRLFKVSIPCSYSWWQSTCLSSDQLVSRDGVPICFISERAVQIPEIHSRALLDSDVSVVVYPEVGDLQASTYGAIGEYQILINLGTGSQVIFPCLSVSEQLPYYRFYNSRYPTIPAISHIPCGRLLAEYAQRRQLSFSALQVALEALRATEILSICYGSHSTLLSFPGFSFEDFAYHQEPTTTLDEIAGLAPNVLLSLWIYQYYHIICKYISGNASVLDNCTVGVFGSLGGIGHGFASLLAELLPQGFEVVNRAAYPLPSSLFKLHQDARAEAS